MLSKLATPHIRCCLSAIPSDLMKSTVVEESLSSMNQQFCSRENQFLQNLYIYYFLSIFVALFRNMMCVSALSLLWYDDPTTCSMFIFWQKVLKLSEIKIVPASDIILCGSPYSANLILHCHICCFADRLSALLIEREFCCGNL